MDRGDGRFSPREVTLGHEGRGRVEIMSGLEEGERVVTSAQFLIDSEASLQEAVQKMIAASRPAPVMEEMGPSHHHHTSPDPDPPAMDHSGHDMSHDVSHEKKDDGDAR